MTKELGYVIFYQYQHLFKYTHLLLLPEDPCRMNYNGLLWVIVFYHTLFFITLLKV